MSLCRSVTGHYLDQYTVYYVDHYTGHCAGQYTDHYVGQYICGSVHRVLFWSHNGMEFCGVTDLEVSCDNFLPT